MNLNEIKFCPCTLAEGNNSFSLAALRLLFGGKKVSHILDFNAPRFDLEIAEKLRQNSKTISISGVQFKQSLVLDNNKLRLSEQGEFGQFILKPIPFNPHFQLEEELPANEHLTMQIAKQVYGVAVAECALVFFKNGEPAYITKRFDYTNDGKKILQEDFASIIGKSSGKDGINYRNSGCYEEIATNMKKYVSAYDVDIENFFERIVFNYLFSNGDAHLKNFSLQKKESGDYRLSPAYDLINTSIHIPDDSFFALDDGLFFKDFGSESFNVFGFYAYDDFFDFGLRIGLKESRLNKILNKYKTENKKVLNLTECSFLSDSIKQLYINHYRNRLKMLNVSFSNRV